MAFRDLQEFTRHLEAKGQLKRIRAEVDPILEACEICQRGVRDQGPALLFERPKGSSIPLLMNLFGTMERIRVALGRDPAEIGSELLAFAQTVNPPSLRSIWQSRPTVKRFLAMRPARVRNGVAGEVSQRPDLTTLPVV